MLNILDTPIEFIENSIEEGIKATSNNGILNNGDSDLNGIYFAGATLCLDIKDHRDGSTDVITLNHANEDFGDFQGGIRRLLSIKALKSFEKLMVLHNINHKKKWLA